MSPKTTYPWFFFYKVARLSFLVFLPTLFIILFFYRSSYREGLVSQMSAQVKENLKTTKATLEFGKIDWTKWCQSLDPENTRYSIIKKDGKILCDTLPGMVGKVVKDKTELQEIINKSFFSQVKESSHYGTKSLFAGLKINDETVLRKIVPISSLKDDMGRFDRVIFLRIVPFAFLSFILYLVLFYNATKPLGTILEKVKKFKIDIPFSKNLELLYKKDEWSNITEALSEADNQLKTQIKYVQNENEKIAAILESISDNIIAVDSYETVLFYNSKFKRNFMKEKATHEIMPKLWHTFTDEEVLASFKSVLNNGEAQSLKGLRFLTSQVPERFFDLAITSLRNTEGKIIGALGVLYDITDFRLTEQMRVNFVANVSHEIRTPLTSIKGYTQVLESQKQKIDPELHAFLGKIISNTERMISLFNDLLSLSVIESKNIIKFEELDLNELIESVGSNIITNYPNKKVIINYDMKLSVLRADARLMEQVLSNLIDNACKYSGESITINVATFSQKDKGYITVADNGPGISREHIQRIFERFYRVDSSRELSRGTGLGLSIVKHIISKHGGSIWAESVEKNGSNFVIELPLS